VEAPKIFKALPVIAHLITLLGTFFLSLCGAFRLNYTGIWEVTNDLRDQRVLSAARTVCSGLSPNNV
jgi:hypothetical protein